jgi:hypothetical protein
MRKISFLPEAFENFNGWTKENKKFTLELLSLSKILGEIRFRESVSLNL